MQTLTSSGTTPGRRISRCPVLAGEPLAAGCAPWHNRRVILRSNPRRQTNARPDRTASKSGTVLSRQPARGGAVLLLGLALAGGLSSCSPAEPGTPAQPDTAVTDADGTSPAPDSGAAAAGQVQALQASLESLAGTDPSPDRNGITEAFAGAGFAASEVEVSADRTPTGLDVDSIQGAAVQDGECIFGEVRDGQVTVSVLPVLAGGRCFIGD